MAAQAEMAVEGHQSKTVVNDPESSARGRGAVSQDSRIQRQTEEPGTIMEPMIEIRKLTLTYGEKVALEDISLDISKHQVTAFIGPSGCGKSTLLRCLNRLNDLIDGVNITGTIRIGGIDINDPARNHRAPQASRHGVPEI